MDLIYWSVLSSSRRGGYRVKGVNVSFHYYMDWEIRLNKFVKSVNCCVGHWSGCLQFLVPMLQVKFSLKAKKYRIIISDMEREDIWQLIVLVPKVL